MTSPNKRSLDAFRAGAEQPPDPAPKRHAAGMPSLLSVDKLPYKFWPQTISPTEPPLPLLDLELAGRFEDHDTACLNTDPHHLHEGIVGEWHGVKVLGVGGYGAAGLWVQVDSMDRIVDVSPTLYGF
jgi:hypothetical protein